VSNNSGVYRSEDGGESFINLNTPVDSLGITSFIYDEDHIWWATAGTQPTLYSTTDGGMNWTANTTLTRPKTIAFYDQNIGVASSLPYMYYTEDGGQTWQERERLSRNFGEIIFGNSPEIAYVTSDKNLYTTIDGFQSIDEYKNILSSASLNGLFVKNDDTLIIGASYSTIAESHDNGITWSDISGKIKPHITAFGSANGRDVFACGSNILLHTADGGQNWSYFDSIDLAVRDLAIDSNETLILSGTQRIVTKDMETQVDSIIYGPVPGIFQDFHITPSGRWIAYNTTDYFIISDDKGITWEKYDVEEFSNGINMTSNGDLFLRTRGKLLYSNDEGDTWKELYTANLARDIEAMSVTDSTIYIMEGINNLRKSDDYGVSWDSLSTPTGSPMIVNLLHFINPDTGYLYDRSENKLWYTFDGGLTWPFSYIPKASINGIYEFDNGDVQSTWLYGFGGFIEKQSDCKNPPLLSAIEGMVFPCILDTVIFSVNGSHIDKYYWSVPDEWEIVSDENGPEISIYAIEPGVGYLTVYGENACGTTDALELQIAGTAIPEVELLDSGSFLETEADGETFQWYRDGILIPGADDSFYIPTESGDYTVLVTFSTGCSRLSNTIEVFISGVDENTIDEINIFPNPATEVLNIRSDHDFSYTVTIINTHGQVIHKSSGSSSIDLSDFTSGLYTAEIRVNENNRIRRAAFSVIK
jgi:photosystem II stability/assembly factor-like uncharacterized protein